jgi:hypothetical protein
MRKVSLSSNSVAFFDEGFGVEPGFYILEGDKYKSTVKVYDGGSFAVDPEDADGLKRDVRGRPVLATAPSLKDEITVEHETNMAPTRRVWPSPDGDGFVFDPPSEEELPTSDDWAVEGGEE